MTTLNPERALIQAEQVVTRRPVSESIIQPIASSVNHILLNNYMPVMFKLNGPYKAASGKTRLDGFFRWAFNAQIINVTIFNGDPGLSGQTEVDIKKASVPGGVFSSIFLTTPIVTSSAVANVWCGVNDVVSGCRAPVLTSTPDNLQVSAGEVLRLDLISTMAGNPKDLQIQIDWLPR